MSRLHEFLMRAALPMMAQPAASQVPAVHLDSAGARLEVTFPDLRFVELGRTPTLLAFEFDLPDTVELTPTRLDSIAGQRG